LSIDPVTECGNAAGTIIDDSNKQALSGAVVTIAGQNETSKFFDGAGIEYQFVCTDASQYRLPVGTSAFAASLSGYYNYSTAGNNWYAPMIGPNIKPQDTIDYDARLWPKRYGQVHVEVLAVSPDGEKPLPDAAVILAQYTGAGNSRTTGSSGTADFSSILENWPPADLPADGTGYYNQAPRAHTVTVKFGDQTVSKIIPSAADGIGPVENGETLSIIIKIPVTGGGM